VLEDAGCRGVGNGSCPPAFRSGFFLGRGLAIAAAYRGAIMLSFRTMEPRERAMSIWYRIAGLIGQREIAVDIIEAEIRAAQHEALLEAEQLIVKTLGPGGFGAESLAKTLRERAERTIRPRGNAT